MSNQNASILFANIAKILIVIGLIFVFWKIITKHSKTRNYREINSKTKLIFYNLHKACFSLATILGFIHALVAQVEENYLLSGWILGISMLIMMGQGIYLGFKTGWQPFSEDQDQKYKKMRIMKWILTIIMLFSLVWHYFPTILF